MRLRGLIVAGLVLVLVLGAWMIVPTAKAAPEVRPFSDSTYLVVNADTIVAIPSGSELRLTSPSGGVGFYRQPNALAGTACFRLSGTQLTGTQNVGGFTVSCAGTAPTGSDADSFGIIGTPGDGTWTLSQSLSTITPNLELIVNSKRITLTAGVVSCEPERTIFWNWHIQTPSTDYSVSCPNTGVGDPEQDVDNARFFQDAGQDSADEDLESLPSNPGADPEDSWVLRGSVSPDVNGGREFTASQFVYIKTSDCGASCAADLRIETGEIPVSHGNPADGVNSETVVGLEANTGYSFQFIGQYASGLPTEDIGLVLTFTTTQDSVAMDDQIATTPATNIGPLSATLNGVWTTATVNGDELSHRWFAYLAGTFPGDVDLRNNPGVLQTTHVSITETFSETVSGLTPNTVYTFQAFGERQTAPTWTRLGNQLAFQTQAQNPPIPITTTHTASCPSTLTVNGQWVRGLNQAGNTFVRFAVTEGPAAGDTDLRDNVGVVLTTLIDDGAAANGDHTATATYNNAVGNSYQFFARDGASGAEQVGTVVSAPPSQCNPTPSPTLPAVENERVLLLTVSQAQCDGDKVSFVLTKYSDLATLDADVQIIDTETNTVVISVDDSEMFNVQGRVYFFNRTLGAGPWAALATLDVNSALVDDFYAAAAFNVPAGDCGSDTDHTTILNEVLELETDHGNQGLTTHHTQTSADAHDTTTTDQHTTQGLYAHCRNTTATAGDCEGTETTLTSQHTSQGLTTHATSSGLASHAATSDASHVGIWARLNTTCQKLSISTDDCEAIKASIDAHDDTMTTQHAAQDLTHAGDDTAVLAAIGSHDGNQTTQHTTQGLYAHCGETRTLDCEGIKASLADHEANASSHRTFTQAQFAQLLAEHFTMGLYRHHSQTTADVHDTNQTSHHTTQGLDQHSTQTSLDAHDADMTSEHAAQDTTHDDTAQITAHDAGMTVEHAGQDLTHAGDDTATVLDAISSHDVNQTDHHTTQGLYGHSNESRRADNHTFFTNTFATLLTQHLLQGLGMHSTAASLNDHEANATTHDTAMDTQHAAQGLEEHARQASLVDGHMGQNGSQTSHHDTVVTQHTTQGLWAHCGEDRDVECEGIRAALQDVNVTFTGNLSGIQNLSAFFEVLNQTYEDVRYYNYPALTATFSTNGTIPATTFTVPEAHEWNVDNGSTLLHVEAYYKVDGEIVQGNRIRLSLQVDGADVPGCAWDTQRSLTEIEGEMASLNLHCATTYLAHGTTHTITIIAVQVEGTNNPIMLASTSVTAENRETVFVKTGLSAKTGTGGLDMQLSGLTIVESWTFLFLFILWLIALKQGWWVVALMNLAAPLSQFFDNWPIGFPGHVSILMLSLVLQYLANLVWKPMGTKESMRMDAADSHQGDN